MDTNYRKTVLLTTEDQPQNTRKCTEVLEGRLTLGGQNSPILTTEGTEDTEGSQERDFQ